MLAHTRAVGERRQGRARGVGQAFDAWAQANPERHALLERMARRQLPDGWADQAAELGAGDDAVATRKALAEDPRARSADVLPELWGGSADLAESNNTTIKGADSFGPATVSTKLWGQASPYGRTLHFGVREHAMGSILNGIALHGGTRVYGGTFLVFSDYMRPAVRLAALMKLPTTYVWTHDSIGLGEDGPTHQPIEHLAALRAIPGLSMVRPADANETAAACPRDPRATPPARPGSRSPGRTCRSSRAPTPTASPRGGYVLAGRLGRAARSSCSSPPARRSSSPSRPGRSSRTRAFPPGWCRMPCVEWFDAQDQSYRDSVLPPDVKARVAVEAGIAQPWHRFVGDDGEIVSIEHFGASADYKTLFQQFGFTTEHVVEAGRRSLARANESSA